MQMLIKTTDGLRAHDCRYQECATPKDAVEFLKGNCTTAGFAIQYGYNPTTGEVIELFKKGKPCQRDLKPLMAEGFTTWCYSWAFAPKNFRTLMGDTTISRVVDLVKIKDVLPWARGLGF